jgi:hypothetical protein
MVIKTRKREQNKVSNHSSGIALLGAAISSLLLGAVFAMPSASAITVVRDYFNGFKGPYLHPNGCAGSGTNQECAGGGTNGDGRTYLYDDRLGDHWGQTFHEMDQTNPGTPSTGFTLTLPSGNNCINFRSYLDGKGFIDESGYADAQARYGGNVFKWDTAQSKYVWTNYYYAYKTTPATWTLDNIYVSWTKTGLSVGSKWTTGSLLESFAAHPFGPGTAISKVWDLPHFWHENELYMNSLFCA